MNTRAIFGINVLVSFVSSVVAAALFAWPWLRTASFEQALLWLVAPHMFLRFIGLSFLIPGVVSASLPKSWAAPAAWGDFVAGVLAVVATAALSHGAAWAVAAVWIFNLGAQSICCSPFTRDAASISILAHWGPASTS
jgi:hypothetical protein